MVNNMYDKQWYTAEYSTGIKRYFYAANMREACQLAHVSATAVTCIRLATLEEQREIPEERELP